MSRRVTKVDFAVLGPMRVHGTGGLIRLSGKPAAALCALLLHPNTVVSKDRLVAALWDDPPHSAVANVQTYIARLRRALKDAALTVETTGSGYLCAVEPHRLDLLAFQEAVRRARAEASRGQLAAAGAEYGGAMALWRGAPAENIALGAAMAPRVTTLEEQFAVVRSEWIDTRLALGQGEDLVADLRMLVAAHPLHERQWSQLMLALDQAGRRSEALDVFRQARQTLVAELGIEPGHELRESHARMLGRGEPPRAARRQEGRAWTPVCQLPPDIADFVGRRPELDGLLLRLRSSAQRGSSPAITVVSGLPGVGKTTLAIHLAHLLRSDYPDGQLFVRLRDGSQTPREPSEPLGELLQALGTTDEQLPHGVEKRAALFRQRLADRAVLIVLDDAVDAAQVRPLLPGTPRNAVLVTSRIRLATMEGAHQTVLGLPTSQDARLLLERIAGQDRLRADPEAAEQILRACGRLPLAIRVVGARLATRPAWPLRELAGRLEEQHRRLDELAADGLDVRAAVAGSYTALPSAARRAFRLLGMVKLESFAPWQVTALLGASTISADESLEMLVVHGLLEANGTDGSGQPRYRLHDLLRVFARERAAQEEGNEELVAAVSRYLTAHRAQAKATVRLPLLAGGCGLWRGGAGPSRA
ncbi:BTAD domain-containing putative transcriptional regulator [Nonomuraea sp. NPDC049152]|uniref:AfsR/SARP family transcriptional regulator n=1 Tax=Nonomuraea sp. NPDC049152 TaxID=3154350 RepID=UPI0033E34D78